MKYGPITPGEMVPWQPSTWPPAPLRWSAEFHEAFSAILRTTVLMEIDNVIQDADASNGGLTHRGHVVALSLFCAVDMASAYAYQDMTRDTCKTCGRTDSVGPRYKYFVESHFPDAYRKHAADIYQNYRNSTVHSWHLFRVGILPGREPIGVQGGALVFGLIHFFEALEVAVEDFLAKLERDPELQKTALKRYQELRGSARP